MRKDRGKMGKKLDKWKLKVRGEKMVLKIED